MNEQNYMFIRVTFGVIATIGLYSVLYRENKFYRFFEHMFLGLASGWTMVTIWVETLKPNWYDKLVGSAPEGDQPGVPGRWAYVMLLPIGLMGYMVFNKKHNWMSRIPIGIILGLWAGQQVQIWFNTNGPQIAAAMRPVIPQRWDSFIVPSTENLSPEAAAEVARSLYPSEALNNLLYVLTLLCVLSYFLFSFDVKNKVLKGSTTLGRWLLMIGFGAIFGTTVTMRFTLLIDRMYFVWIEWFQKMVLRQG